MIGTPLMLELNVSDVSTDTLPNPLNCSPKYRCCRVPFCSEYVVNETAQHTRSQSTITHGSSAFHNIIHIFRFCDSSKRSKRENPASWHTHAERMCYGRMHDVCASLCDRYGVCSACHQIWRGK